MSISITLTAEDEFGNLVLESIVAHPAGRAGDADRSPDVTVVSRHRRRDTPEPVESLLAVERTTVPGSMPGLTPRSPIGGEVLG